MAVPGFFLCLLDFGFEGVPEDLTCPADAFFVGVGVHPESYGGVAVSQTFKDRYNVSSMGQGDRGGGVSELVAWKSWMPYRSPDFLKSRVGL